MRCFCCNRNLSDYESTLRSANTNDFLDTCMKCLNETGIQYIGRNDLSPYADQSDDEVEWLVESEDEEPTGYESED